jgi:hypothetical protein
MSTQHQFSLQLNMPSPSKEARVILALKALRNDKQLKLEVVAKLYNIPASTSRDRRARRPARHETTPNSRRHTDSEEKAIVQYMIDSSGQSFPPRLRGVEDMANQLLRLRGTPPVGKL